VDKPQHINLNFRAVVLVLVLLLNHPAAKIVKDLGRKVRFR
jgi:hypothetical protein